MPAYNASPTAEQEHRAEAHGYFPRDLEWMLLCAFLILHFGVLARYWGETIGHDSHDFLRTVIAYRHFGILVPLQATYSSYHPPLSFLLTAVLSSFTGNLATGAQLLSSLSILGAFLLLRKTLSDIHILHTAAGVTFLYSALSLPVFIYLTRASTYDTFQFFLSILTLHFSIALFWNPKQKKSTASFLQDTLLLTIALTAGLFTKYSCILNFSLPLLVLFIRFDRKTFRKALLTCCIAGSIAIVAATPYYYTRYFKETGKWLPVGMEWHRPEDLQKTRAERDAHPLLFTAHMLRVPTKLFGDMYSIQDSLWHHLWYHTWKTDWYWMTQGPLSSIISTFYATFSLPLFAFGFLIFIISRHSLPRSLNHFGWIFFLHTVLLLVAILRFAYEYPLFDWALFKPKYIAS
ncbi:hypothetical protein COU79_02970, partial [Candidatus Peregrinibacteria bacterium CG10_big_fil_rev_8_21_14_0_10_54_7]